MPRRGEPLGRQKQDLTLFGEWVDTFCTVLGTTQPKIAALAGLDQSTVSYFTRDTPRHISPAPESVRKLWLAFTHVAEEKGFPLAPFIEEYFVNASGYASEYQLEISRQNLVLFKKAAQDRHEQNVLLVQFQELERVTEAQKQEIARLNEELRKEKLSHYPKKDRS